MWFSYFKNFYFTLGFNSLASRLCRLKIWHTYGEADVKKIEMSLAAVVRRYSEENTKAQG